MRNSRSSRPSTMPARIGNACQLPSRRTATLSKRSVGIAGTGSAALVSTKVTIGYDAPWRQVHALLIAAATRTEGLRAAPAPFVYQRGLSDFYVEYEVFAYMDQPIKRVSVLSALHANIQDEFNAAGVQIMSPHFVLQPRQAVVAPRPTA